MYALAVYGSGFAGFSVVAAFLEAGHSVLVVEKGPRADFRKSLELSHVVSVWESVEQVSKHSGEELAKTRCLFVGLGGTSNLWSGKWRALDNVDFLRSKKNRCWPFQLSELDVHYRAVEKRFGFSLENDASQTIRSHAASVGIRLIRIALSNRPVRLAEKWIGLENEYPQLTILSDVEKIEFHVNGGTVEHVRLSGDSGYIAEIGAKHHVIAAGGIASAGLVRELQCAARGAPQRFLAGYMDHPTGVAGLLWPTRNLESLDQLLTLEGSRYGFSLPEYELLERGIGNHVVFLNGALRAGTVKSFFKSHPIKLGCHVDQFPESCNGIDYAGPAAVRWRISAETRRDVDRFLQILKPRMEALFGRIDLRGWIDFHAASHPSGCTPMSDNPSACQLHPNGRLSEVANAYCISSSAFPFAGSANPTMTIAALGNRLAQHLTAAM